MKYNKRYTIERNGVKYDCEVNVDIKESYGSFEVYNIGDSDGYYVEGGLWFEGDVLRDYDGVYELPECVKDTLTQWNFNLEEI